MKTKNKIIFAVIFLFLSSYSFGQSGGMKKKFFMQGMIGRSGLGESKDVAGNVNDDQELELGTSLSAALGYKWDVFSLEFLFSHLGKPTNNIGDYYEETHEASFIGGGLHWTWSWFDLKVGWGSIKDKASFKQGPLSSSFAAVPNNEKTSHPAGYFGIGVNFDLGADTEFIIDYTGFGWSNTEPRTLTVNGIPTNFDETEHSVAVFSLGLRWFL